MEILIENENTQLAEYKINFEQAKTYLQDELKKYNQLVVSEEFMQMAKKSRAELNAKKKELTERFRAVKKRHNEPIDILKTKVDELLQLIDEPLASIDERIKEYEQKRKEEKYLMIQEIFNTYKNDAINVEIGTIFKQEWLNTAYSKKKITEEISLFFERIQKDLEVIESFDDEFVIPLKELYLTCFDMSIVMQKKIAYDKAKVEKYQEQQKALQEQYKKEQEVVVQNTIPDEPELTQEDFEDIPEQNIPEVQKECEEINSEQSGDIIKPEKQEEQLEYIEFWVKVTPEQKLALRNCVLENKIKCGKLVR